MEVRHLAEYMMKEQCEVCLHNAFPSDDNEVGLFAVERDASVWKRISLTRPSLFQGLRCCELVSFRFKASHHRFLAGPIY